jgi:hypothetical protein
LSYSQDCRAVTPPREGGPPCNGLLKRFKLRPGNPLAIIGFFDFAKLQLQSDKG